MSCTFARARRCLIVPGLVVCLLGAPAGAEDYAGSDDFGDFSALDLAALLDVEVKTGGSGVSQKLSNIPAVVEVWTAEDLSRLGIRTVRELLEILTGTYTGAINWAPHIGNNMRLRGGSVARRIALMVDDHNQLDEFDEGYNPWSIPIEAIERVEFLRGPASVLYGSSAMAGVVRLVTRDPEATEHGGTLATHVLDLGRGIDGSAYTAFVDPERDLRFRMDVQAGNTVRARDRFLLDDLGDAGGTFGLDATYVSTLATVRLPRWNFRLQHHYLNARISGFVAASAHKPRPGPAQLIAGEAGHSVQVGDWTLRSKLSLDFRLRDLDVGEFPNFSVGARTIAENRSHIPYNGLLAENAFNATYTGNNWHMQLGIQNRLHLINDFTVRFSNDDAVHPFLQIESVRGLIEDANLFVQGAWSPVERLSLLVGARLNAYKPRVWNFPGYTPSQASPAPIFSPMGRFAVVYAFSDAFSSKLMYGRSFRLPSALELFSTIVTVVDANPFIDPELQDTYELAFDWRPSEQLSLRANGFVSRIFGTIDLLDHLDTTRTDNQFRNSADTLTFWGGEWTGRWIPSGWLSAQLGFTFHEGRWDVEEGRVLDPTIPETRYASEMPRVISKGSLTSTWSRGQHSVDLTPGVSYRGAHGSGPADTLLHLGARWRPHPQVMVFATARNLLNEDLFVIYRNGAPEAQQENTRVLRLGLSASF